MKKKLRKLSKTSPDLANPEVFVILAFYRLLLQRDFASYLSRNWAITPILDGHRRAVDVVVTKKLLN
ncbi:MAG: hypothetical protein AAB298_03510 [Pseudomonadota bacterium]